MNRYLSLRMCICLCAYVRLSLIYTVCVCVCMRRKHINEWVIDTRKNRNVSLLECTGRGSETRLRNGYVCGERKWNGQKQDLRNSKDITRLISHAKGIGKAKEESRDYFGLNT